MSISSEGWKELVAMLEGLDDVLLDKLDSEIWSIQMERALKEGTLTLDHDPASDSNVLPFRRNEDA